MLTTAFLVACMAVCATGANIFGIDYDPNASLYSRLINIRRSVEINRDGRVDGAELATYLGTKTFDSNRDSCLNQDEWVSALVDDLKFTRQFAEQFKSFVNRGSRQARSRCDGLDLGALRNGDVGVLAGRAGDETVSLDNFVGSFVQTLIDICEAQTSMYNTNVDCRDLPDLCTRDRFACTYPCLKYRLVTRKDGVGEPDPANFVTKLERSFAAADANSNNILGMSEKQADLETNFDLNEDDCVDEAEFKTRMAVTRCKGFGFTEPYVDHRFQALKSSDECDGIPTTPSTDEATSREDFMAERIRAVVDYCDSGFNYALYTENIDCRGIPLACAAFNVQSNPACKEFQELIATRPAYPFKDSRVIYYNFVKNYGNWTFEDVFPNQ